jgi:hypothetical protein
MLCGIVYGRLHANFAKLPELLAARRRPRAASTLASGAFWRRPPSLARYCGVSITP